MDAGHGRVRGARGGGRARGRFRGRGRGRGRGEAHAQPACAHMLDFGRPQEPVASTSTAAAQQSTFSLSEDMKKIKKGKAWDKQDEKVLSVEQQNLLFQLREQKQVAWFLMPDAPKHKRKIKASPHRRECPLLPGTPRTPPPRKPQPWKSRRISGQDLHVQKPPSPPLEINSPDPGPSGASVVGGTVEEKVRQGLLHRKKPVLFSSSTEIQGMEHFDGFTVVDAEIETIGFTLESSVRGSPVVLGSSSPSLLDKELWCNVGSDDEDLGDLGDDGPVDFSRNAADFPAVIDTLLPDALQVMAMDALDDIALRDVATTDMLNFEWMNDSATFLGEREVFTGKAGPTFDIEGLTPLDIFLKIWDDRIIEEIVRETNRYANNCLNDPRLARKARMRNWRNITKNDLWLFFGIIMLQGIIPLPVEKEYWTPCLPYLKLGNFSELMSFERFLLIKKCLHFVDNDNLLHVPDKDKKLAKIQPVIDHLNEKFSSLYLPEQDIAIDESLLLWKGRLSFVQLIANKAAKVGIKSYELCESKSGYLWKMIIYTGKQIQEEQESAERQLGGVTSRIVFDLVGPLLDKGHTLVMDSFYNSPLLSRMLKARRTDTMGTLRLNRQFVPESLRTKSKSNMRTGEVVYSQTADLSIVVWKDSNIVSLLSTYHDVKVGGKEKYGQYKYKPSIVLDYNLSMGGIDKKDQLLQAFPIERVRNNSWYKKLFRRIFNVSIHNAYIMYGTKNKSLHRQFRVQLADEIIKKHLITKRPSLLPLPPPRSGHYPQKVTTGRPRCKWCASAKVDTRTNWKCDTCHINLCIIGCFRNYHISLQKHDNS